MKTIIKKIHNWEEEYLVRKSKYLFFLIVLKVFFLILFSVLILQFATIVWNNANWWIKIFEIIIIYILLIRFYISLTRSVVNYFYDLVIISNKWVYKLKLWLFLSENTEIVDLYKIQEIKAHTEWIVSVLLNIWDLHLVEQKDTEKIVHFIDNPEFIANIIRWVQHHLIQQRYSKK